MKKFLSVMLLAVILIFVEGSQAEAREVYVGRYSDGTAVYLLTDTIVGFPQSSRIAFTCKVRAGRDYLEYTFFDRDRYGRVEYRNSEGYSGHIDDGYSPVARAIWNYCS